MLCLANEAPECLGAANAPEHLQKWFLELNLACERKVVLDSSEESAEWSKKTCLLYKKKIKI